MTDLRFDANLAWLFTELDFEARFDAAAAAGFAGVEFPDPYPYQIAQLTAWLADAGLTPVLINTPAGAPGSPGQFGHGCLPDEVAAFRDGLLRALDYATGLGCSFVHVMGGQVPAEVSQQRGHAQYVANIVWAAEQARGTGVRLVLEALNKRVAPRFVLADLADAAAVAETAGLDQVGLMIDFFHLQIDQGDLIENFLRYQHLAAHLQLADVPGRHEPGTGEINFDNLLRVVAESGYSGWIGLEYRPARATPDSLEWIHRRICCPDR